MRKIGFNGRPFCGSGVRGLGRHTLEVIRQLRRLEPTWEIYVYAYGPVAPEFRAALPGVIFRDAPVWPKLKWDLWTLPRLLRRDGVELYHSTINVGVPWFLGTRVPTVVTIHDSFTHEARFPRPRGQRGWWGWLNYRLEFALLKRADGYLTVSQTARGEIARAMAIELSRIDVCYNGANLPAEGPAARDAGEDYYLYVGGLEERKNAEVMLEAFVRRGAGGSPLRLAGGLAHATARVTELLRSHPELFVVLGQLSDEELSGQYRGARALIFPSLREGFGLPLVEAMLLGCPVIASDIPVFRELAEQAAWFFPPQDPLALVSRLGEFEAGGAGLRARLRDAGLRQAARFEWEAVARACRAKYQKVLTSANL